MKTKHISIKTRQARIERHRRYHYYTNTPLVKLIKPEYHHVFRRWYESELKNFLKGTEGIVFDEIYKLDFNLKPYSRKTSRSAFIFSLARFLTKIGKGNGLEVKIYMIFRYITDKKHSNIGISENELKRSIYKAFKFIN